MTVRADLTEISVIDDTEKNASATPDYNSSCCLLTQGPRHVSHTTYMCQSQQARSSVCYRLHLYVCVIHRSTAMHHGLIAELKKVYVIRKKVSDRHKSSCHQCLQLTR